MADDDAKAQHERTEALRREMMEKSATVMATSVPTPTQEENDLAAMGQLPDGPKHVDQPTMPTQAEYQAMLAKAEGGGSSRTVPRHEPAHAAQPHRTETSRA